MYLASSYLRRLMGVWSLTNQGECQALCLMQCCAIHTIGLGRALDVVFLDAQDNELRRIDSLAPNRFAWQWRASKVVELPDGYCCRDPDYLHRIRRALKNYRRIQMSSGVS